jgi:hypothetical protein
MESVAGCMVVGLFSAGTKSKLLPLLLVMLSQVLWLQLGVQHVHWQPPVSPMHVLTAHAHVVLYNSCYTEHNQLVFDVPFTSCRQCCRRWSNDERSAENTTRNACVLTFISVAAAIQ